MLWYGPHTEPSSMYPSDRQGIIRDVIFGHYHASVMFKTPFLKFRKRACTLQTLPKISRFYRSYSALYIFKRLSKVISSIFSFLPYFCITFKYCWTYYPQYPFSWYPGIFFYFCIMLKNILLVYKNTDWQSECTR